MGIKKSFRDPFYVDWVDDGAVVTALPSHQFSRGSTPPVWALRGLSLLLEFAQLRGFFSGFSPSTKTNLQIPVGPG